MRSIAIGVLVTLLGACGTSGGPDAQARGGLRAVKQRFVDDAGCAPGAITVKDTRDGYVAEGCGEVGLYAAACNVFGYCPTVQGQVVSRLVRKQAAFDLGCDGDKLQVSSLNDTTFGARGCARQASYVVVGCFRGGCKVVQNTQTQR